MTHLASLSFPALHRWLNPHRHTNTAQACECAFMPVQSLFHPSSQPPFKNVTYILFLGWPIGGSKGVSSVIMGREGTECCLECGRNVRGRKCCLSKQAGISIKDRLFCLSLEGKMEKERQVLTSWQVYISLPPSVSYLLTLYQFCFCGISEEKVLSV